MKSNVFFYDNKLQMWYWFYTTVQKTISANSLPDATSAKIHFIDTGFICLVTACMSYYSNWLIKNVTIWLKRDTLLEKNGFIKCKIAHKRSM